MINFQKITPDQREIFQKYLLSNHKGCEYSFANLCIWGRQQAALVEDFLVIFSQFDRRAVYPFPIGTGEVLPVLDAIIADAKQRGIPCCLTGLNAQDCAVLEQYYPGKFRIQCDRNGFDYVYHIDDLADLKGRKYQKKRNHLHRFHDLCPNWRVEPLTPANLEAVRQMADSWYRHRQQLDPQGSYHLEQVALNRAFDHFPALGMEGLVLFDGDRVLAFTMASALSEDNFDVHFEKAREDVEGAYTAINREFACYLRNKYPSIQYLDREDDLGLEGLRKAKLSYCPNHMVEKYWARLWEEQDAN